MRITSSLRHLASAALLALVAASTGCGGHAPLLLRADPSSFYASGYCVGSSENVKVFVESMTFLADQKGMIVVELAIWNERPQSVRFLFERNTVSIGGRKVANLETQATVCKAGEVTRETLRFRTDLLRFDRATLSIDGVEVELGTHLHFDVSMYADDGDEGEGTQQHVGQGLRSH